MFCPNCGAENSRKQSYCRYCGLNLLDTEKSLTSQLAFGVDSNQLRALSSVKRNIDTVSTVLVGVLLVCGVAYLFFERSFGTNLLKVSLAIFFLLKTVQEVIGYYQRRERGRARANKFEQDAIDSTGSRETARLPEAKPFEPVPSVVDNSTELLPLERKARKFE